MGIDYVNHLLFVIIVMPHVKKVGMVACVICIMSHPIPDTSDSHSVQVILPKK
jgi:hypothetical protein